MKNNFIAPRIPSRSVPTQKAARVFVYARTGFVFVTALVYCLSCLPTARAQLYTGSIAGTVTDPSGAFVSGAQVKATDAEKGFQFSATTDSGGR